MKQPLHNAEDFIENLAQKLEGNFYTEPITERSEKVSLQDPYAVPLPSPDQEQEQARQNMLKAEQSEDRLASETFIDDITAAKHPGPLADEVYQDFRNQESSNKLESGEIWEEKTLDPGTRLVRVIGPDSNPYSVYWTDEEYLKSEKIVPADWNGSFEEVDIDKVKETLALPEQKFNGIEIYTVPAASDGTGIKVYESVVAPSRERQEEGEIIHHMGGGIQYIVPERPEKENMTEIIREEAKTDVAVVDGNKEEVTTDSVVGVSEEDFSYDDVAAAEISGTNPQVEAVSTEVVSVVEDPGVIDSVIEDSGADFSYDDVAAAEINAVTGGNIEIKGNTTDTITKVETTVSSDSSGDCSEG